MKAILTIIAIVFFGVIASAQEAKGTAVENAVQTITVEKVETKKIFKKRHKVSRLYMFKNSRVKKELSFRTKRNRAKLA
ncbi:hypothetical protein [Flagellimonas lutaonensis]|uniref:Uncharacterized protein n=1 Tax=Flagellimonas lutaonensis TaxID=516051 RepID=A0A0D5YPD4_9FLAO|nr:hypothetical protein [Allomuricauda lutaonensis]AKA34077.1 hypothetical protein VC82_396 [Allomuricauda lutaonensis]